MYKNPFDITYNGWYAIKPSWTKPNKKIRWFKHSNLDDNVLFQIYVMELGLENSLNAEMNRY